MSLDDQLNEMGRCAREAASVLRLAPAELRTAAIRSIATQLRMRRESILAANAADVARSTSMIDRLRLDPERLEAIALAVEAVADQADPVSKMLAEWNRPNGLHIQRVSTPIGVIGLIFESRPNVAADAAALCVRSANAIIMRCGSDALATCLAISKAISAALEQHGLPTGSVQLVPTSDRAAVAHMLGGLNGSIDLIIPRGGRSLVALVQSEARVPVLGHLEGLCHTYVHSDADPNKAIEIVLNGKMRRVSVCGATETLLIDRSVAPLLLPQICERLRDSGCEIRGDEESRAICVNLEIANEADWRTEYLAPIISVRVVADIEDAIAHIRTYCSGHTDSIITESIEAAEHFISQVDSAIVMWNTSTQFADGGEFGMGAEIGISTDRLHARGPVGAEQLMSYKYVVKSQGAVRL